MPASALFCYLAVELSVDFGKTSYLPKSRNAELSANSACRKEPAKDLHQSYWSNPEASKRLIKQLLALVNSKEEYELLVRDLAELEHLFPSSSDSLKGDAAEIAVQ